MIQVDTTGVKALETVVELEVLFSSFDEIGALEHCHNLKKLTRTCLNCSSLLYLMDVQYWTMD